MSSFEELSSMSRKPPTRMQWGVITERIVLVTTCLCLIVGVINAVFQSNAYNSKVGWEQSSFVVWIVFYNFTIPIATLIFQSILVTLHWSTRVIAAVELASAIAVSGFLALGWLGQVILWTICTVSIFNGDTMGVCLQPKLLSAHDDNRRNTLLYLFMPQPFMMTFGVVIIVELVYYIVCGAGAITQERRRQSRRRERVSKITWVPGHEKNPSASRWSAYSSVF